MTKFATKEVDVKWIFLGSGHDKDLLNAVENSSNIKLFIYDKSDIEEIKKSIPKLVTVKGTAEFHEIIATTDGTLYAKNFSSEKEKQLKVHF
ncbi:unnamed protein product [Rotaria sp. Silwood2]|nr:unnamed protein product [Rotaria sp. Silwood2]